MDAKAIKRLISWLGAVLILLGIAAATIFQTRVLVSTNLGPCGAGTNSFVLNVPKGTAYQLLMTGVGRTELSLGAEGAGDPARIEIRSDGKSVYSRPLRRELVKECNWLRKYGHSYALILTMPSTAVNPALDKVLKPGHTYTVELVVGENWTNAPALWFSRLGRPRLAL